MLKIAVAGVAVAFATIGAAHAQGPPASESSGPVVQAAGSAQGAVSSLAVAPVAPPAAAPVAISTAAAAPAAIPPASFGSYSFEVAANLISRLCLTAGGSAIPAAAQQAGLPASEPTASLTWALPAGVQLWSVESVDSDVYLYAYGPDFSSCGAVIARPLPEIVAQRLRSEVTGAAHGYAIDSESQLEAGVKFTRFRSGAGRFADMLEYPSEGDNPGLVKIELLAAS